MWIHPSYHLAEASPLPLVVRYLLTATPAPTVLLGFLWPWKWGISSLLPLATPVIYSGLISFRIDWFDLLTIQGTLKSLLQYHSWKESVLQHSAFFIVQLWWGCRRRQWHPTPVLLPAKPHEWRSLVGCSPWGRQESDMTERLHFHFSLSCIEEGNDNPLQCSCLENPSDGEAWWASVYGVAESDTTEVT